MSLSREVDARLKMKCDKLSDAFVLDDNGKCELQISDVYGDIMVAISSDL